MKGCALHAVACAVVLLLPIVLPNSPRKQVAKRMKHAGARRVGSCVTIDSSVNVSNKRKIDVFMIPLVGKCHSNRCDERRALACDCFDYLLASN